MKLCPCHSGEAYATCCQPAHQTHAASNALLLMRSRYSAYALKLSDYIIATTHPASKQYRTDHEQWGREILDFRKNTLFRGLEILEFTEMLNEEPERAYVTFTAHLLQGEHDATFTEKSLFEKLDGRWLYREAVFLKP